MGNAEITREKILQSAFELFQERGYEETTMRDIASRARVALGGAYYYFKSKEDLVLHFYRQTQTEMVSRCESILNGSADFKERLRGVLELQFEILGPQRNILDVLLKNALSPQSTISPFSPQTGEIRNMNLELFRRVVEDCRPAPPQDLKARLPYLLWLMQMGLILVWLHDKSRGARQTLRITALSVELVKNYLKFHALLPGKKIRLPLLKLLTELEKGMEGKTTEHDLNREEFGE